MKILKKILKGIGLFLIVVLAISGIVYYKSVHYNTYSLKVEKSNFPEVKTEADFAELAKP